MDNDNQSQPTGVERVEGDAFFLLMKPPAKPEIPDGLGHTCPQCKETAWRGSRWCWHCKWDFQAALRPRVHPIKILALAVFANACAMSVGLYVILR